MQSSVALLLATILLCTLAEPGEQWNGPAGAPKCNNSIYDS